MKKTFTIGLLVFALLNFLAISAFAASSVVESGSSPSWSYTATFDGADSSTPATIHEGDMYLLIAIKSTALTNGVFPTALTADAITYIDQKTATSTDAANNTVVFSGFIPMNYAGGTVFVTGGSLTGPVALGTLTGHGVLGDANGDANVNVADITAIRDNILERTALTGTNLAMADVNNDASVNVADITKIRDFILERITSLS